MTTPATTAAPLAVPADLADFCFPRSGSLGDLATRLGVNLYRYPNKAEAARRWLAGVWGNAVGEKEKDADWIAVYHDGCNEVGWIGLAGLVLERYPELTPWVTRALGG